MTDYAALLDCYRSGQINEKQWATHKREDPKLSEWLAQRAPYPGCRHPELCIGRGYCPREMSCGD